MSNVSKFISEESFRDGVKTYLVEYELPQKGWFETQQRFVIANSKEEASDELKKSKYYDIRISRVRRLKFGIESQFEYKHTLDQCEHQNPFEKVRT